MQSKNREQSNTASKKPTQVYLFGTCLIDAIYPQAGVDSVRLLRREGIEVLVPKTQTCCGQPAYNSGYDAQARDVARQQIKSFELDIPIVVPAGSCAGMMAKHYPELFRDQPDYQQACDFAERVFELSEFLLHVLAVDLNRYASNKSGDSNKVALHVSCAARREMGVADSHKQLLMQQDGVELYEPERAQECCGFGGTFAVKQPEISAAMAADKCAALAATGCQTAVTGDCGCMLNLAGTLDKIEQVDGKPVAPIKFQHLASFLWEQSQ